MRGLVAGTTGAIGRPPVAVLHAHGHAVAEPTRDPDNAGLLSRAGLVGSTGPLRAPLRRWPTTRSHSSTPWSWTASTFSGSPWAASSPRRSP